MRMKRGSSRFRYYPKEFSMDKEDGERRRYSRMLKEVGYDLI